METSIRELQKKLSAGNVNLVEDARVQRQQTFGKISELERIKQEIADKTRLAIDNIELFMTKAEVRNLIGEPRSGGDEGDLTWNYGKCWIVFKDGLVDCIVKAEYYQSFFEDRAWYSKNLPKAIIK
jgi:hypothetical protein